MNITGSVAEVEQTISLPKPRGTYRCHTKDGFDRTATGVDKSCGAAEHPIMWHIACARAAQTPHPLLLSAGRVVPRMVALPHDLQMIAVGCSFCILENSCCIAALTVSPYLDRRAFEADET